MKKLLKLFDNTILKFGVAFAIVFIAWYPKLPSINIPHTWVYIRLEDFLILGLAVIWGIQLVRKKVSLQRPEGYAIIAYWIVGLISLLYCFAFIAPHLANFFPKIAWLQYIRRIEYMILFFIAYSTIKNIKDVYFYIITVCITLTGVVIYGFGQRFVFLLWKLSPEFFKHYPFCFPAFLTGNEEFAKGTPFCLNETSRITSTFGGHYDLSAYLVLILPLIIALVFTVRKIYLRVLLAVLGIFSLELLNFTSSRTSFAAYVIGVVAMLVLWQKKRWIIPILVISTGVMLLFGNATIQRFSKTVQEVKVVSTNQQLPSELKKMISQAKDEENIKKAEVPPPSDFTVGKSDLSKSANGYTTTLTDAQLKRIENGDIAISSVSGSFLIKKAYALDISFTTRFQGEWPRNWKAFLSSPLFGTGYSSLTLATDNDYLRALGETGLVGTISFFFIFVVLGIYAKYAIPAITNPVIKGMFFGLIGGMIGLLMNAILIDVFEASKVAEFLWIILGIAVGAGGLFLKKQIPYRAALIQFFTSNTVIFFYLLVIIFAVYGSSLSNFFVADDFIWLRWAASSSSSDLLLNFINSQEFFYRPITKIVVYYLYTLFSFQPEGYHLASLVLHYLSTIGVLLLANKVFANKFLGFCAAILFAILPAHAENIFWFSTLSGNLSNIFCLISVLAFYVYRQRRSYAGYIIAIISCALALLSYEMSVILPVVLFVMDILLFSKKPDKRMMFLYLPFVLLLIGYFMLRYISDAFISGGDYSYNVAKIIPNTVGNIFGYIGMFIGGNVFVQLYDTLRSNLRSQWVAVTIVLITAISILLAAIVTNRKKFVIKKNELLIIILFGLLFGIIGLLPFLPLGNIAMRYLYTASIGFSIAFVAGIAFIVQLFIKNKRIQAVILGSIIFLISCLYIVQNISIASNWNYAGTISKNTLTFFRTKYANFNANTTAYFVHIPVQRNGVWVFPVGLQDGMWFIYREQTPQVFDKASMEEGENAKILNPNNTYIFQFKNDTILEVR